MNLAHAHVFKMILHNSVLFGGGFFPCLFFICLFFFFFIVFFCVCVIAAKIQGSEMAKVHVINSFYKKAQVSNKKQKDVGIGVCR